MFGRVESKAPVRCWCTDGGRWLDGGGLGLERHLRAVPCTEVWRGPHMRPGLDRSQSRSRHAQLTVTFSLNLIQPKYFHSVVGSASELSTSCPTVFFMLSLCDLVCKGHSRGTSVGTHHGSCAQ